MTGRADSAAPGLRGGPRPGLVLGDRYRLEELLAVGGMGAVWRATDELLARPVAVKLLRPELAADPSFLARFRAEARHAAAVRHPGVAAVHDYAEDGGVDGERQPHGGTSVQAEPDDTVVDLRPGGAGTSTVPAGGAAVPASAWLVMDLVQGEPLSAVLAREGRLGTTRTLRVVAGVADALAAAHAVGVVHRDVKPGNLLLATGSAGDRAGDRAGDHAGGQAGERVVVTDFGIARAAGAASLTRTGTLVGTAAYLSPEQAAGRVATAASDLYALGVVAYECLAGHKPFEGDSDLAVALAHGRDPVPPLPADVPAPVRALVLRLLAKDPQQRPATAAAVAARARLLAQDPPPGPVDDAGPLPAPTAVLPLPSGPTDRDQTPAAGHGVLAEAAEPGRRARRPLLLGVAAGGVLLLGGLLAGALLGAAHPPGPSAPSPSPARPSASTTPSTTVRLDPASYLGQPADRVRAELTRLGLAVRLVGTAGDGPVGTVAALDPTGVVARGTTITLRVVEQVPRSGPAPGPKDGSKDGSTHDPKDEHAKKSGTRPGEGDRKGKG
ncbi:MAG TPA: serine/threonine protein kinase [Motilibacteraceae bacterium]|nr:serine/threonine protein kinase [Motilibacteraceae bacterium]